MTRAVLALSLVAIVGCKADPCPEEDQKTFYADADGDGFGSLTVTLVTCDALVPEGFISEHTDCDDLDASAHPGGAEVCDQVDNDCDGAIDGDTAAGKLTFFADTDGDTFGDAANPVEACDLPEGYVIDDSDCDDKSADNSPVGIELCDGADNDCNGAVDDDAADGEIWHADFDGDGFGNGDFDISWCGNPEGYVKDTSDCNDQRADVFPGQVESCNGIDDDCDGRIDPNTSVGVGTWFADDDGDGFADDAAKAITQCIQPTGSVLVKGDCADDDGAAYPGADESCDGSDNDCDGIVDWGLRVPDDYADLDDAIGAAADGETVCLSAGTYTGNFNTNGVSVTIEGEGSATTILDGGAAGSVFTVKGGETVRLAGVTLQNGKANKGAALYVASSILDAEDVIITGNTISPTLTSTNLYSYGIVFLSGAEVNFTDVDITNNTLTPDFSTVTALTTSQTSAYHYLYGGLLYTTGTVLQWDGGSMSNNTVSHTQTGRPSYTSTAYAYSYTYGGLGYASGSIWAFSDLDISSNTVAPATMITTTGTSYGYHYLYGGLFYPISTILTATDVDVQSNSVTPTAAGNSYGYSYAYGLIYSSSSSYTLNNFNLVDNDLKPVTGTLGSGYAYGGLYANSGSVTWNDSEFSDNEFIAPNMNGYYGYAYLMYVSSGKFKSDGLTIDNNTVQVKPSGATTTTSYGYCYGMYLYAYNYNVTLDHLTMTNNTIDCAQSTSTGYYSYPMIWIYSANSGTSSFSNSIVANNTLKSSGYAWYYGMISLYYYNTVNMENTVIANNTMSAVNFDSNSSGQPIYGPLGVYGYYDSVTLTNTSIDNNTVSSTNTLLKSGAIVSYYGASTGYLTKDWTYNNFYNNSKTGGVWYLGASATDPEGTDGNINEDPAYTDAAAGDYTLDSASALIDAGDPAIEDVDASTSDIGAYGGPNGDW